MIADNLLPEFTYEASLTRKMLERVDLAKAEWRPHPKSMTFGHLTNHLVEITNWSIATMTGTGIDFEKTPYVPLALNNLDELVSMYDRQVKETEKLIANASDEHLSVPWTLKAGDHIIFSMPRVAVIRGFCIKHSVHHRGQMSVYLRMNDIAVPSIYGPSADEPN